MRPKNVRRWPYNGTVPIDLVDACTDGSVHGQNCEVVEFRVFVPVLEVLRYVMIRSDAVNSHTQLYFRQLTFTFDSETVKVS